MTSRFQAVLEKEKQWRRWLYRLLPRYCFSNDLYEVWIKERLAAGSVWVDLGCGRNELAHEIAGNGAFTLGLDAIQHRDLNRSTCPFILGEVNRLPLREGCVHLLSSNMLLEHLEDPHGALLEMQRALKSGGWLILRTPNALHPLNLMLRLIPERAKIALIRRVYGIAPQDVFPTFYRANRLGRLRRLIRKAGFADVLVQAVEDVHTAFGIFFWISLAHYFTVRMRWLAGLRTNFVVLARKI